MALYKPGEEPEKIAKRLKSFLLKSTSIILIRKWKGCITLIRNWERDLQNFIGSLVMIAEKN